VWRKEDSLTRRGEAHKATGPVGTGIVRLVAARARQATFPGREPKRESAKGLREPVGPRRPPMIGAHAEGRREPGSGAWQLTAHCEARTEKRVSVSEHLFVRKESRS